MHVTTGMRLLVAGFLGVLALAVVPAEARACSCVRSMPVRSTVIAGPGEAVPTDVVLRVFLEGGYSPALRKELHREYRLRDEAGVEVPLRAKVTHTRLDLTPKKPLKPGAKYRLERIYAYDAKGVRIDDRRRLEAPAEDVRRAWFVEAEFETGSGPGGDVAKVELAESGVSTRQGGGDCGPGVGLHARIEPKAKLSRTDIVEVEVKGVGVVATKPGNALDRGRLWAGDLLCTADKVTIPDTDEVRVRVAMLGSSGKRETGPWVAVKRKGRTLGGRRRVLTDRGFPKAWFDAEVVAAKAATENSPPACVHGFDMDDVREAAPRGGPWIYEARSSMGWVGDGAMVLVGAESGTDVLNVGRDGKVAVGPDRLIGVARVGWADLRGGVFATREWKKEGSRDLLYGTGPNGAIRWERELEPSEDVFIADGIDRLLVARGVKGEGFKQVLGWTVVSRAKGRLLERTLSHHAMTGETIPVAALVGRNFLVAYGGDDRRRSLGLVAVSKTGDELWSKTLPVNVRGPMDAISAGQRMALVSMGDQSRIEFTLIGDAGDIIVGPVDVSAGAAGLENRKPRVAWDGKVFAVAWETFRSQSIYVTAVDTKGRASPAFQLRNAATAGLATTPNGFISSFTRGRDRVELADLTCRTEPQLGAPQRVSF